MSKKTTLPGLLTISVDALIRAIQLPLRQAIGTASTGGWQAVERYQNASFKEDFLPYRSIITIFFVPLRRERRLSDKTGGMVQALFSFRNIGQHYN